MLHLTRQPPLEGLHQRQCSVVKGLHQKQPNVCREVLKEQVIPYAIKWFTGEAQVEDSDEDYEDEDDEDDDEVTPQITTT